MVKGGRKSWYVESLDRGIRVIRAFTRESPILKVTEVANRAGISRAAARRFLNTLAELGYVGVNDDRYFLRPQVLNIGYSLISSMNLDAIVQPIIDSVSEQTGASSSIAVLDNTEIIFVARSPAKSVIQVHVGIGARIPAYTTSLGKVLLASLPQDRLNKVLAATKFLPTQNMKKTTARELRKELSLVRTRGYATSVGMLDYAIASVAVPILDARQRTVAAINISTNVRKLREAGTLDRFIEILKDASEKVSISIRAAPDSVFGLLGQG